MSLWTSENLYTYLFNDTYDGMNNVLSSGLVETDFSIFVNRKVKELRRH